jgi:hypothetical protein
MGGKLFIQGTNQAPLEVALVDVDIFVTQSAGVEIDFERDCNRKVVAFAILL